MSFGEHLRILRVQAGLTQQQVAEELCLSTATYSGYEIGRRRPDITRIKQLASILGVSGDVLLETGLGDNAPPSTSNTKVESSSTAETNSVDSLLNRLLSNYADMNDEGRERLAEISDDMIAGGRYKKQDQLHMGKEA